MNARSIIESEAIRVIAWSEDPGDDEDGQALYDPWEVADAAEKVFKAAGLRAARNKELGLVAFEGERVVGCTFHRTYDYGAENELPDGQEDFYVYDFDLAADPNVGRLVAYPLVAASIKEAKSQECRLIRLWVINPGMARLLETYFGFKHDSEPANPDGGYSTHMELWL